MVGAADRCNSIMHFAVIHIHRAIPSAGLKAIRDSETSEEGPFKLIDGFHIPLEKLDKLVEELLEKEQQQERAEKEDAATPTPPPPELASAPVSAPPTEAAEAGSKEVADEAKSISATPAGKDNMIGVIPLV